MGGKKEQKKSTDTVEEDCTSGTDNQKENENEGGDSVKNTVPLRYELDCIADGMGESQKKAGKESKARSRSLKQSKKKKKPHKQLLLECVPIESLSSSVISAIDKYIAKYSEQGKKFDQDNQCKKEVSITTPQTLVSCLKHHCKLFSASLETKLHSDNSTQESNAGGSFIKLLGFFNILFKDIQGFSRLKGGDQYEVLLQYGSDKWKTKVTVKGANEVKWSKVQYTIHNIAYDTLSIEVMELKRFGKMSKVGSSSLKMADLFSSETTTINLDLTTSGTLKLNFDISWFPFDFDNIPTLYPDQDPDQVENSDADDTVDEDVEENSPEGDEVSIYREEKNGYEFYKTDVMAGHTDLEEALYEKMCERRDVQMDKEQVTGSKEDAGEEDVELAGNQQKWLEAIVAAVIVNHELDNIRGQYPELYNLEAATQILLNDFDGSNEILAHNCIAENLLDMYNITNKENLRMVTDLAVKKFKQSSNIGLHFAEETVYEAIEAHLKYSLHYLKDVGRFGPLQVKEIIALHKLKHQSQILLQLINLAKEENFDLDDIPSLMKRRTLLEFWRSCCDGESYLCVNARIMVMELESEFGREVRLKHPDVAGILFPELVCRILGQHEIIMENHVVTIFQLLTFLEESILDENLEDMGKAIDKLALEMFLTATLQSTNNDLILVAIRRVGTLLALRTSNLRVLAHLLLSNNEDIRRSAKEHLVHISSDISLRDKAVVSYAELLECPLKKDRQCACIALGFLRGKECIPQIAYLYHGDPDKHVREGACHALAVMGDDGKLALEHSAATLQAQTMTQIVNSKTDIRMGTAL